MRRSIRAFITMFLLFSLATVGISPAHALKTTDAKTIAIVFDNSGSMYEKANQAWCRATYAMEVFASMLNQGDTLLIYPMHPITVDGNEYTMTSPLKLTDSKQATTIRNIYTEDAGGTPIESIDCAVEGLQGITATKKYLIVLTDGGTFSKNGSGLTTDRTKRELDKRIQEHAGPDIRVMYLGIGSSACMPTTAESEFFVKRQATNSEDVLSSLTEMCNLVFGRDNLPKNHISDSKIDFDITMSKLIVFVQGENISNLSVTNASGAPVGQLLSTQQTCYSTAGTGDSRYKNNIGLDTSLQGMMVTYADCAAGSYTINYTGTATSKEVYYEPDADLDFVFTDAAGNNVDPNALYEGEYKVSFGIKDAKTGQLISSELLGSPKYHGSYFINDTEYPIDRTGYNGEVPITLSMGDTFRAKLTTTYLSGYTITKSSADFGWPELGIKVAPRPAGDLRLEISGGDRQYSLQKLEEGAPYIAKVFYQGTQLTGAELDAVDLKWDSSTSNAEVKQTFKDDHYELSLHYKDPNAPQETKCGPCTVSIDAHYTAQGSSEAVTSTPLTYNIIDDFSPLRMDLYAPSDYILIREIEESQAIVVNLSINGAPLTAEEFANVELQVDCGPIAYAATPKAQDSAYEIKLLTTPGIDEGDYPIQVRAKYTDSIGRVTESEDGLRVTLSNTPLWVKWAIRLLVLLIVFIIIMLILHIKVMPKPLKKSDCAMSYDGEDVAAVTNFDIKLVGKQVQVTAKYGGDTYGLKMDVKPGKNSYVKTPLKKRSMTVRPESVQKLGSATVTDATIGSTAYELSDQTNRLVPANDPQKPFDIRNSTIFEYSGTKEDAGQEVSFSVSMKVLFKK